MIAILAPEPNVWLESIAAAAARVAPVLILAPWATPPRVARLARFLPQRLVRFAERRALPIAHEVVTVPGWSLAEGMVRAWVRGRADRNLRARIAVRRSADMWAARWLAHGAERSGTRPRVVLAPALSAERTLARAASLGMSTFLIEDLPGIRGLHRDLDRAASNYPDCKFLLRFRAPDRVLIRQEVERALADHIVVRGAYALESLLLDGVAEERIAELPARDARPKTDTSGARAGLSGRARVLLAGLAAARHGTVEALAVLEERPLLELVVRAGEGLEPRQLLAHPRVHRATSSESTELAGIDVVIAPALCEAYPRELELAAELGVPVVCTRRCAGFVRPDRTIPAGDPAALGQALDDVLARGPAKIAANRSTRSPARSLERSLRRALAKSSGPSM